MMSEQVQALVLALAALVCGPLIYALAQRFRLAFAAIDGFVLAAVGSLVLLHVVPDALAEGGVQAVLLFLVGLASPLLLHRLRMGRARAEKWLIVIGLVGLMSHSAFDGAGLATSQDALSWAIVLHRIPAGAFVWWLVRPTRGRAAATAVLAAVGAATAIGFFLAQSAGFVHGPALSGFEAFVGGALLHVLLDHGPALHGDDRHAHSNVAELAGAVAGIALVMAVPDAHEGAAHGLDHFGARYLQLVQQVAPTLLAAYLLIGLVSAVWPRASLEWIREARGGWGGAVRGAVEGASRAVRAPRVLPAYDELRRGGVTGPGAVAFMVAASGLGIESLAVAGPLLGVRLTVVWVTAMLVLVAAASASMGARIPSVPPGVDAARPPAPSPGERVRIAGRVGFVEAIDATIGWVAFGLAVVALFPAGSMSEYFDLVPVVWAVPLVAAVALPLSVGAAGAAALAATLLAAGASPPVTMAALVAGAATSARLLEGIRQRHGRGAAVGLGALTWLVAVAAGAALHLAAVTAPLGAPDGGLPLGGLHPIAAVLLAIVGAASLARQGPRGFVLSIAGSGQGHEHHHHAH